jgi:hypothetical protein
VAGRLLGRFREETGEKSAIALSALRELYALTCRA